MTVDYFLNGKPWLVFHILLTCSIFTPGKSPNQLKASELLPNKLKTHQLHLQPKPMITNMIKSIHLYQSTTNWTVDSYPHRP